MPYVDGFGVPVPKKKVEDYRKIARKAGRIWREQGALDYVECGADDVKPGKLPSFPQSVKLKKGETVVFRLDCLQVTRPSRPRQRQGVQGPAHGGDVLRGGLKVMHIAAGLEDFAP